MSVHALGQGIAAGHLGVGRIGVAANDLPIGKVVILREKLDRAWRDRITVSKVVIKRVAANEYVFRIGGLEQNKTTPLEHPIAFCKKQIERLEGQMFDDMKSGNSGKALIGHAAQIGNHVALLDIVTGVLADLYHRAIEINATCRDALPAQVSEQLATTAANVE